MPKFEGLTLWTDKWVSDTHHLTRCERGTYMDLLILMWRTPGCSVPDDDLWLAKRMKMSAEQVETELRPLIREFCKVQGSRITQKRLLMESERVKKISAKFGALAKSRQNKEKDSCVPRIALESESKPKARKKETDSYESVTQSEKADLFGEPKPKAKKGKHRLPDDWSPSAQGMALAADELGGDRPAFETLDTFRDYWNGTGRMMADWEATWRNWVRREAKRKPNGGGYANGKYRTTLGEQCEQLADELEARERAAGLR